MGKFVVGDFVGSGYGSVLCDDSIYDIRRELLV